MADSDDQSEFSGNEFIDDVGEFDLVDVNNRTRNDSERLWRNIVGDSDYEDDEFGGFNPEDAYVVPEFVNWDKMRNVRQLHVFSERVGPTRVLDGSNRPVDYFKLFYSDHVFAEITRFTNLNAATKQARGDKGVWTDVTVDEIKAYFGILIIMDTMKFDRDELYWSQSESHWLLGSKIGEVMSHDRYVQIKHYLHFSDDTNVATDKLHSQILVRPL